MRRATLGERAVALAGLVIVWMLLWGRFGRLTLLGGVLVAAVILVVFPLPPVAFAGRVSARGVAVFVGCFLRDLVLASAQVAWLAVRVGPPPVSAVIAVPLRVASDLHLTVTAGALSLIPGSLIVEADRERSVLYVHVLGVDGPGAVERARADARRLEARLIRAVGSPSARAALASEPRTVVGSSGRSRA